MKHSQNNTQCQAALLCNKSGGDTPVKNSLCCVAAGITALSSSTTEVLTPHEKLREAATPDATLIAQDRPPAQPAMGYKHVSGCINALPESKASRRYWVLPEIPSDVGPACIGSRS